MPSAGLSSKGPRASAGRNKSSQSARREEAGPTCEGANGQQHDEEDEDQHHSGPQVPCPPPVEQARKKEGRSHLLAIASPLHKLRKHPPSL